MPSGQRPRAPLWVVVVLLVVPWPAPAQPAPAPAPGVGWAEEFEQHDETFSTDGRPSVVLRFLFDPQSRQRERLIDITKDSLRLFSEWLGPYPGGQLTVVHAAWNTGRLSPPNPEARSSADPPGVVVIASRWLVPQTDVVLERSVIAGVARQFWLGVAGGDPALQWFEHGLARYSAERAIDDAFQAARPSSSHGRTLLSIRAEGPHLQSYRYFGDFVPYTVRWLSLSRARSDPRPPIRHVPELDRDFLTRHLLPAQAQDETDRAAAALQSLERYIGWPAMQQALLALRERHRGRSATPADLFSVVSEQRGHDLSWFLEAAFGSSATCDYAIESLSTRRDQASPGFETVLRVRRQGDAMFARGADRQDDATPPPRVISVVTRFEDGSVIREWWDDRKARVELVYSSSSPAMSATVDPEGVVLLDVDRSNNTRVLGGRFSASGARLALNWLTWLQDLLLTCTSIV